MAQIEINSDNIIMYYGNKAGYIKEQNAIVDSMFVNDNLINFLATTNKFNLIFKDGVFDVLCRNAPLDAINIKSCRVYQLKADVDIRIKFICYDDLVKLAKLDKNNYKVVYDGGVETNDLEEIYQRFHTDLSYDGHPMSMSDVIELYDDEGSTFYYVDNVGFRKIKFEDGGMER